MIRSKKILVNLKEENAGGMAENWGGEGRRETNRIPQQQRKKKSLVVQVRAEENGQKEREGGSSRRHWKENEKVVNISKVLSLVVMELFWKNVD
jgi:hypothetical protein